VISDPLSDALSLVRARCQITGGFRAGGQWSLRFRPQLPVKLDALVEGRCWLLADGQQPVLLEAGEAVVLSRAGTFVLCSDPAVPPAEAHDALVPSGGPLAQAGSGAEVVVVGGHVEVDGGGEELLLPVLPRVTRVASCAPEAAELRSLLQRLLEETTAGRPGAAFAAAQYAQLLLVQVLRLAVQQQAVTQPGWLSLLGDPALRPALTLMHENPGRPWGLEELASAAAMSRSTFATRFRVTAGQPPLAYLTRWRMRLAERALRDGDTTIAALAAQLGYASESSFSHAFQRVTGSTPGRYRRTADPAPARPQATSA
jgi:AraC-like DNA-binding protein